MSSSEEEPVLKARGIHRYLGNEQQQVHVLRGVDIDLYRGNTYAIVGPSGCGKSTLLYTLGLLDRQNEGSIILDGIDVSKANEDERTAIRNQKIGFVFQFHFLLPEFTAAENLMIPMWKRGNRKPLSMERRAHMLLQSVGLGDKTHRLANRLSGGEQQRVAVARSLANDPPIVLADEPTGNLDVKNSNIVFDLLYQLSKKNNQAVLIVTHNPDIARRCDYILKMRDGLFMEPES
ncbi:MAG: ABC transporter ATP-binding protein [Opitutales bacterium]|nr:ABC transporter ATP-binding protein [Opitutales bacterium]